MVQRGGAGQLDQISEAIGELKGSVKAIDRYIHEREHSIVNLTQSVNGIGTLVSREVAKLRAELKVDLDSLSLRVTALEKSQERQTGERGLVGAILRSPLLAWMFAIAVLAYEALKVGSHR
jgi:chaperonin cofactor prefoldin